jgi:hypothetical protein
LFGCSVLYRFKLKEEETMIGNRRVFAVLAGILLISAAVLAGCGQTAAELVKGGPSAWVGGPPDGSEVPIGEVFAMCHAFARGGVSQIELYVNGSFANRAANPDAGNEYFTTRLAFETTGPGSYVLHCRTYDAAGAMVQSEPVTVRVSGEEPTPTTEEPGIPTATPTSTEVPPTPTLAPTGTPVPPTATSIPPTSTRVPPTSTPLPPTPTPLPIKILSFEVSQSQVASGQCVHFTWLVQGSPSAIFFDGEGVTSPDARDRCPTATRDYDLRVEVNGQVADSATLTVVVVPGDTTGPVIGRWAVSPGLIYWDEYDSCAPREVTVNAYSVSDPSGVSGVKVVYRMKGGSWQAKGMTQVQTGLWSATIGPNDLELSLNPPVAHGAQNSLECRVEGFDSVGNQSQTDVRTVTVQYYSCVVR